MADSTASTPAAPAAEAETIAALRRAKAAAEAANEAKTRYLVAVSHEIRSPLNAIYGYAQLLERDGAISCGEAGAVIRRSAEHLTNLVEGLLEISRIESGVLSIRSDLVNIRGLLGQVVEMFRVQAAAKGIGLTLEMADALPPCVKADEKRLRQILINLVSNAVKYTEAGGATVTVGYCSQVADVEVRDTGIGIPAEDLQRIFEPFERGRTPEAQAQPGIGLGLAITQALTRIMGGDLAATSMPGAGSTFRLRLMLPAHEGPGGHAPRGQRLAGYRGARRTVLVIDDDPAQAEVLGRTLRPLGFTVHVAANGADGLARAEEVTPDLVLLDLQMPGLSGWETAARLRQSQGEALRIVIASANAHEFSAGGDGEASHDAFITKPIHLDDLLVVIGNELGLEWEEAPAAGVAVPAVPAGRLPPIAAPFVERLRELLRIGHISKLERTLDDLEQAVPAGAAPAALLRRHLADLDLRAFARTLDDAASS